MFSKVFLYLIVSYRILAVATSLVDQVEDDFESNELYRAKFNAKNTDIVPGANRNPLLYLPSVVESFGPGTFEIELIGRLLWHNSNEKVNIEAAYRFYRKSEYAFPDKAKVKLLRASCLTYLTNDVNAFTDQLTDVETLNPPFLIRFLLFKRITECKIQASSKKGENDASLDMVAFVEFQKYFGEAQRFNNRAIRALRQFWTLFLQPTITTSEFIKYAKSIETQTQKALSLYKSLIVRYPKQTYLVSSYAYFLELVVNNGEEASLYHRRADQLRAKENDETGLDEGGSENAIVSITEDGTIEQVNKAVTFMFGWNRNELLGRNVKLLVPSPYREKHDQFLDRYRTSGNAKVIGQPPRK